MIQITQLLIDALGPFLIFLLLAGIIYTIGQIGYYIAVCFRGWNPYKDYEDEDEEEDDESEED